MTWVGTAGSDSPPQQGLRERPRHTPDFAAFEVLKGERRERLLIAGSRIGAEKPLSQLSRRPPGLQTLSVYAGAQ